MSAGSLTLAPDTPVPAGSFGTWTFEYTPGENGLQAGECIDIVFFTRFSTNLWSIPQTSDPTAPGFITARRSDGGFVFVEVYRKPSVFRPHGATVHVAKATVGGDTLAPDEKLSIVYGDKTGGSPGTQAQPLAREVVFPVFVGSLTAGGTQDFASSKGAIRRPTLAEVAAAAAFTPSIRVIGGEAASLGVCAPSLAKKGTTARVRIVARDAHGNIAPDYAGSPRVFIESEQAAVERVQLTSAGPVRIVAVDSENRLTGTSAPILVSENVPELNLYWGEIHTHTIFSDALGQIDEHFGCAINNACLDFGAVSDHDTWLHNNAQNYDIIKAKTEQYNKPGEFVTLLGYEMWVTKDGKYSSHANIYFPGPDGPMIARMDVKDILDVCRKEGAIAIPHHTQYGYPNMGVNWDHWAEFTPREMPVVEVFSTHGNSEYFGCPRSVLWPAKGQSVQDGLARGYRFGLIGGSDYHECLLGHPMDIEKYPRTVNNRHMQTHTGLAAVYAKELTREAIFDAIRSRRVYATSGPRILLDFRVGDTMMGGELKLASADTPRKISVSAGGTRRIARIEVLRDNQVVHSASPGLLDAEAAFEDDTPARNGTFYYVRVTQADGEQAWSSPVWMNL